MNELRVCARQWLAEALPAIRISIIKTRGSTPQASGAHMLVSAHKTAGTIGGGNLEWQAIARARELLSNSGCVVVEEQQTLGPALGQCCGGALTLQYQNVDANLLLDWPDEPALFELHLFGMGHVAEALVQVLSSINCVVHWYDEREPIHVLRTRQWQPKSTRAQLVFHDDVSFSENRLSGSAPSPSYHLERSRFALIMTHSHALDFDLARALLTQPDFEFIGLIGSKSKRARFLGKFEQAGLGPQQINRLTCPIGQLELKFKQPELLALSIAAQLLQIAQSSHARDAGKVSGLLQGQSDRLSPYPIHAALTS